MNQRTARLAANSMDENCGYAASVLTAFGGSRMFAAMRDIGSASLTREPHEPSGMSVMRRIGLPVPSARFAVMSS